VISKRSLQRHISKEKNACKPTLSPGYVITVEPGIYFIPELIDRWKAENKCASFIDYDAVKKYKDFGGIRIEDDCLVTESGCRELGKPIPRTIEEVEQASS
jgi:Xaa-Pro aminopeptidase